MANKMKKYVCTNCGKSFEIPEHVDDPLRCPYCGAGPGVLIRVYDEKPQIPIGPPSNIQAQPQSGMRESGQSTSMSPLPMKRFMCFSCRKIIEVPYGVPKPMQCPYCGAPHYMIHRVDAGGFGRYRGYRGRGWR